MELEILTEHVLIVEHHRALDPLSAVVAVLEADDLPPPFLSSWPPGVLLAFVLLNARQNWETWMLWLFGLCV